MSHPFFLNFSDCLLQHLSLLAGLPPMMTPYPLSPPVDCCSLNFLFCHLQWLLSLLATAHCAAVNVDAKLAPPQHCWCCCKFNHAFSVSLLCMSCVVTTVIILCSATPRCYHTDAASNDDSSPVTFIAFLRVAWSGQCHHWLHPVTVLPMLMPSPLSLPIDCHSY